ncbi:DUF1707 domain-containing protein [Micromonospora pisi]|uniref:DUF1707 domain-containing protein n=1 Tax=Micromonospora pisi TaxID=589240 RepID=UPI001FECB561|nr:DUF1707 domain-containing protein [Micromonospora pisi]
MADPDRQAAAERLPVAVDEGWLDRYGHDERLRATYAAQRYAEPYGHVQRSTGTGGTGTRRDWSRRAVGGIRPTGSRPGRSLSRGDPPLAA